MIERFENKEQEFVLKDISSDESAKRELNAALDAFAVSIREKEDQYRAHMRKEVPELVRALAQSEAVILEHSLAGRRVRTAVIPAEERALVFVDVVDSCVAGAAHVTYDEWAKTTPQIYGTFTDEAFAGGGMNSRRIALAARYIRDTRHEALHSSRRFDDERARSTWVSLTKRGLAEWVSTQARYRFKG